MKHIVLYVLLSAQVFAVASVARASSDVRDFEVLAYVPNNTAVAWGYFRHVSSTQADESQSLGIFRATYVMRFGALSVVPFDALLPVADVAAYQSVPTPLIPSFEKLTIHAEGVSDPVYLPTIAYTFTEGAPSQQMHTVVAFNPWFTFPWGNYREDHVLNVSSNRFTFQPQIAVAQRFMKFMTAEAVGYLAVHTDNTRYEFPNPMTGMLMGPTTLSQNMDYGVDVHLAADLSRSFFFAASYYFLRTGKESLPDLGGATAVAAQSTHTLRFSFGIRIEPQTLALLQFNQDVSTTGGAPITRFVGIRLTHSFSPGASSTAMQQHQPAAPPPPGPEPVTPRG